MRRSRAEVKPGGSDESRARVGDGWRPIAPESAALWRIRSIVGPLVVGGLYASASLLFGSRWEQPVFDPPFAGGVAGCLVACLVAGLAHSGRYARSWRYRIDDGTFVMEWGVYWHRRAVIPRTRVVTFEIAAGPVRRRLGIWSLRFWTGHSPERLAIPGLSAEAVAELKDAFGFGRPSPQNDAPDSTA